MRTCKSIKNGFWFSLGFGMAIVLLTMVGCFRLTEWGLDLLVPKGDTEVNEHENSNTQHKEDEVLQASANDVNVPEAKRRSDIELAVAASIINERLDMGPTSVRPPGLFIHLPAIRDALVELKTLRARLQTHCIGSEDFKEDCFALRAQIEETKIQIMLLFDNHPALHSEQQTPLPPDQLGEMKANLKLSYRHLEDASMRLGKAVQAFDGGKSCYAR